MGVEKVGDRKEVSAAIIAAIEFSHLLQLRGGLHSRCYRSTEEAHQSLKVLSYRGQEELLAHEPESPQTQAPQSDLIFQFREQGFHLLSLPLCRGELWCVEQVPGIGGESLWAAPVGVNLYELRNSPWHVRGVNWLDVVEAIPRNENEWPEFVRVHKRSGHRTIHVYVLDAGTGHTQEILDNCNRLGSTYEGMDDRMYALDFKPGIDITPTIEYLESLKAQDVADWRINDHE